MPQPISPRKPFSEAPHSEVIDREAEPRHINTMSDDPSPIRSDMGKAEATERQRRQAEQLRANLARRKEQVRARRDEAADGDKAADQE
jgi:hypothetical protein